MIGNIVNALNRIQTRTFGQLPNGEAVEEFSLTNANGLTLKFITYGGIINELHVPDRHGVPVDVVLGFNNLEDYLGPHPYFGCMVGRVAGRISGGGFSLDGEKYQLKVNDAPNHLHGGDLGFDKRNWKAQPVITADGSPGVTLAGRSPHGDEGYPGNVDVSVTYSLNDANEVVIRYEAVTDQATPLSLTNHSYFNLSGEGAGTIEDHWLQVSATETAQTNEQMTLLGTCLPVAGKASDFTHLKRLGDAIPHLLHTHGDNYLIPHSAHKSLECVARLEDPASGRVLEILTTEDCLQLYDAAFLDGSLIGKSGRPYVKYSGLALECEGYPDGVNHPELGNIILRTGETYRHVTIYRFQNK